MLADVQPGFRRRRRRRELSSSTTTDLRAYREVVPDVVGILHLQGGYVDRLGRQGVCACSTTSRWGRTWFAALPRRVSARATCRSCIHGLSWRRARRHDVLGRQRRVPDAAVLPAEGFGLRVAAFADAGSLWNYVGPTSWSVTGERINGNAGLCDLGAERCQSCAVRTRQRHVRPHFGRRRPDLGFAVRSAPVRLFAFPITKAALRPGPAVPVRRRNHVLISAAARPRL